jgi:Domain of unknown function (DUF4326)
MPKRYQLSRRKGYKLPDGVINAARPSKWGNPFKVGDPKNVLERERVVDQYEMWLTSTNAGRALLKQARAELAGKDLACWCALGSACHAEVLMHHANLGQRTLHVAISVDIDRFSDGELRRNWLPVFGDQVDDVQGLRAACVEMRAKGFKVFPNPDCSTPRKDGTCPGHKSQE